MKSHTGFSPYFWTRGSGKRLRGDAEAQVVAAYLSTAPSSNPIGLYYVSLPTISSDTGVSLSKLRAALRRVEKAGYAFYDADAELVFVPNQAKFDLGESMKTNDGRRTWVVKLLNQFMEHPFARRFWDLYNEAYDLPPLPVQMHAEAREEGGPDGPLGGTPRGPVEGAPIPPSRGLTDTATAGEEAEEADPSRPVTRARTKTRGTTLPREWELSEGLRQWARRKGVTERDADAAAERFTNHWWASDPTQNRNAVKADWDAAYRTWVLKDIDDGRIRPLVLAPREAPPAPKTPEQIEMLAQKDAVLAAARLAMKGEP